MTSIAIKPSERIGARVPQDVFDTLHRAAELCGATLNQFLVQSSLKEAHAVIEREQLIRLSREDSRLLLDLLEAPPAPNAVLLAAQARYHQSRRDADTGFDWQP
jgi:uncharacterized protein (DUF1778 family)